MADYNSDLLQLPMAQNPGYVDQFFRTLGYAYYGTCDVAEVYAIGHRIAPGDSDGYFAAWQKAAKSYLDEAERKLSAGHKVSARRAFLRAAEYHRASHFFLRADLWDPRLISAIDAMRQAADSGYALSSRYAAQRIAIPFEGKELLGIAFVRNGEHDRRRPTVFAVTGYDSFVEEFYQLASVEDLVARGYNVVVVDGPGQGHTLLRHRLFMRPDYENVIRPCLDWLLAQSYVDPERVAVLGRSFGGYLAPRGVLGDDRPCALIVDPGQISFREAIVSSLPEPVRQPFQSGDRKTVNDFFERTMANNPDMRFFFMSRAAVHGCETVYDYFAEMMRYDFLDRAGEITVPTFCTDNPHDFATRGKRLFDALTNAKSKVLAQFESDTLSVATRTGGGAHCEQGFNLPFEMQAFDWLSELINHKDEC